MKKNGKKRRKGRRKNNNTEKCPLVQNGSFFSIQFFSFLNSFKAQEEELNVKVLPEPRSVPQDLKWDQSKRKTEGPAGPAGVGDTAILLNLLIWKTRPHRSRGSVEWQDWKVLAVEGRRTEWSGRVQLLWTEEVLN